MHHSSIQQTPVAPCRAVKCSRFPTFTVDIMNEQSYLHSL